MALSRLKKLIRSAGNSALRSLIVNWRFSVASVQRLITNVGRRLGLLPHIGANEEALARHLAADLRAAGVACRIEGGGVHWNVELEPVNHRSVSVACFWYRTNRSHRDAPEYYVALEASGKREADGRTPDAAQVVECARAWLAGTALSEVYNLTPFIDERRRAMQSLAALLDPRIRWEIGGDPSFELWAHEDERSCCVSGESCRFLVGQAQVARKEGLQGVPAMMASWLLERVGLDELRAQGALIERHAEVLFVDPAKWHWLHVLDRVANPKDALARLEPLVQRLADSPIASRFYSYSSLHWLCFSARSHYPWVGRYSTVATSGDGRYRVDEEYHSLDEAVALIEKALAASPFEPFFGSATDLVFRLAKQRLSRRSSNVQAALVRREQWGKVWLRSGGRQCQVSMDSLVCWEARRWITLECASVGDVLDMALQFLEEGVSFEELAADARVVRTANE